MMVDAHLDGDLREIVVEVRITEADMDRVSFDPFGLGHQWFRAPSDTLTWLSMIARALEEYDDPVTDQ